MSVKTLTNHAQSRIRRWLLIGMIVSIGLIQSSCVEEPVSTPKGYLALLFVSNLDGTQAVKIDEVVYDYNIANEIRAYFTPGDQEILYFYLDPETRESQTRLFDMSSQTLTSPMYPVTIYRRPAFPEQGDFFYASAWPVGNSGNRDIYRIQLDGSGCENLTNTPDLDEYDADVSPDNLTLLYSASRFGLCLWVRRDLVTGVEDTLSMNEGTGKFCNSVVAENFYTAMLFGESDGIGGGVILYNPAGDSLRRIRPWTGSENTEFWNSLDSWLSNDTYWMDGDPHISQAVACINNRSYRVDVSGGITLIAEMSGFGFSRGPRFFYLKNGSSGYRTPRSGSIYCKNSISAGEVSIREAGSHFQPSSDGSKLVYVSYLQRKWNVLVGKSNPTGPDMVRETSRAEGTRNSD